MLGVGDGADRLGRLLWWTKGVVTVHVTNVIKSSFISRLINKVLQNTSESCGVHSM